MIHKAIARGRFLLTAGGVKDTHRTENTNNTISGKKQSNTKTNIMRMHSITDNQTPKVLVFLLLFVCLLVLYLFVRSYVAVLKAKLAENAQIFLSSPY